MLNPTKKPTLRCWFRDSAEFWPSSKVIACKNIDPSQLGWVLLTSEWVNQVLKTVLWSQTLTSKWAWTKSADTRIRTVLSSGTRTSDFELHFSWASTHRTRPNWAYTILRPNEKLILIDFLLFMMFLNLPMSSSKLVYLKMIKIKSEYNENTVSYRYICNLIFIFFSI